MVQAQLGNGLFDGPPPQPHATKAGLRSRDRDPLAAQRQAIVQNPLLASVRASRLVAILLPSRFILPQIYQAHSENAYQAQVPYDSYIGTW